MSIQLSRVAFAPICFLGGLLAGDAIRSHHASAQDSPAKKAAGRRP